MTKLRKEAKRRKLLTSKQDIARFTRFQTDPVGYAETFLGVSPWPGRNAPGQRELFEDIGESVRMQIAGEKQADGREPFKIFRVPAGHGVGKTWGAALLVNWFFDCFTPSVTMTTAPSQEQVELLLWKDIKSLRPNSLPGRVLPGSPRMEKAPNHWAIGRTTSDSSGKGTARFQGQHGKYLFFVVDEAEGVPDFVFDAIDAMMTGGTVIIMLALANPQTRSSRFHKLGHMSGVKTYRLSVLDHPNVVDGVDVVPGASNRAWVETKIENLCEIVLEHNKDNYTFEVPWRPGIIYQPNSEFMFRVLGIAPANVANKTLISSGRYEAATERPASCEVCTSAQLGIDVAGFGKDYGTLYCRHGLNVRRIVQFWKEDYDEYSRQIVAEALRLHDVGVTDLSIRIDAGGGFGQGVLSHLKQDPKIAEAFPGDHLTVHEIHFGTPAKDGDAFGNLITELYADAAESLKGLSVLSAPNELEADLCEREYRWINQSGISVKVLEEKAKFRRQHKDRSPDDGDGFVLAVASEHLMRSREIVFY